MPTSSRSLIMQIMLMASVDRVLGGIRNALILGILILPIGCYGSNQDRPSISSFQADPTTIKNGETSELTAIFDNGNGLVVPGYFYVTSGKAVEVTPSATNTYELVVQGPSFEAVSRTCVVTVMPQTEFPVITTHPADLRVNPGDSATFRIAASGNPPLAFTSFRSDDGGMTWSMIDSAHSATCVITAQAADNGAQFQSTASNSLGTAISHPGKLTVGP